MHVPVACRALTTHHSHAVGFYPLKLCVARVRVRSLNDPLLIGLRQDTHVCVKLTMCVDCAVGCASAGRQQMQLAALSSPTVPMSEIGAGRLASPSEAARKRARAALAAARAADEGAPPANLARVLDEARDTRADG